MKTPDHENRAHSILGASSAKRWMMCPGSVALSERVPHDDTESFFAREGTAAHELCELALTEQLDPTMYVGKRIDGIPVTKEMALAVGMYCDKVNALTKSCGTEPQLEVRFSLDRLDPPVPMFGTGDCVVWAPLTDHLHVLDFKYGKGIVVEAEENPQLMYYALGAVLELKVKPKKITVWIIQPRAPHRDGVVRDYTFTWERLIEYRHELLAAAEATQQPDAELAVGDWCRYCPAHATCPAQERYALTVVQDAFAATTEPFLPLPEVLGEDELNVILEHAELIESWFRSVRKHVFAQLERGEGHKGWKLVAKRATRKWVDEADAATSLRDLGIDEDDLFSPAKLISPAQADKLLRRDGVEIPRGLFTKDSSGSTLAPDSDPRPEIDELFKPEGKQETDND